MTRPFQHGIVILERLGSGSVFEVTRVRDSAGRELICKRVAAAARAVRGEAPVEHERTLLAAFRGLHLPELAGGGNDERGEFLLEVPAAGAPVRELIRQPPLDAPAWLELARASSRALADLHAYEDDRGPLAFVHGDISPDNLFFRAPRTATFVDASSATWREARHPLFQADRGTLPYAAPELTRGEGPATPATDTYALAATLVAIAVGGRITEALTEASRLLEVATRGVLGRKIEERLDLPPSARSALARALFFDPAGRLSSSHELADELEKQVE